MKFSNISPARLNCIVFLQYIDIKISYFGLYLIYVALFSFLLMLKRLYSILMLKLQPRSFLAVSLEAVMEQETYLDKKPSESVKHSFLGLELCWNIGFISMQFPLFLIICLFISLT